MEDACNWCRLPGRNNWMRVGSAHRKCGDSDCDLCTCVSSSDGSEAPQLKVDKDGCKRCADLNNREVLTDNRVGDTWQCWVEEWR